LQKYNAFQSGISTNGARQKLKKLLDKHIEVNNFEDEWLKSDKTIIQIKENIKAIKNANGEVIFFLGVVEDISERKSIELELIKSQNNELKSEKLKSDFLAQISHEIRTPLNSLLSFVSLIKEELNFAESDNIKEYLKHIDKAANRTIRTIDLLVKTSELHTDNYEPNLKDNNLFNLLESIVNDYIDLADEKGINLQFIKAIDEEIVRFDWHTMYDVFMNLIDNAIKYTSSGSVKVYISKSFLNKFTVTVLDTGIGISKEYMNNIFKPFTQETSGYTRKYDGNGLGLALVKEYCSLNNADIFVSSEKGSGSNFTVVFK
jgi:signal transduction histidine kinase